MAHSPRYASRAKFAAEVMRKPLKALARELEGVRRNEDIECVHRMRVASRRLRNALELFGDELPAGERGALRKRLKGVTKSLGAARDLDVQIAFLRDYLGGLRAAAAENQPGVEHVLVTLTQRRAAAQLDVLAALERLEAAGTVTMLSGWVAVRVSEAAARRNGADELRTEAARMVRQRLDGLFAYEPYVERPEAIKELHAMRIAAKHLRYTLEAYSSLYADGLESQIRWCRQIQDWLGELHDCDVWQNELGAMLKDAAPRGGRRARGADGNRPGIERLRQERAARREVVYQEFRSAWRNAIATEYWHDFRAPFASSETEAAAPATEGDDRLRPVLALARSCHYEVAHTHHVTHLTQILFDRLAKLHGLDAEARFWLTSGALLHDIAWVAGRAGHHTSALRMILDSPLLPWDVRLRRLVGLVARYHRKAPPRNDDPHFRELSAGDRKTVRKLAAILRIADALDYSHDQAVEDVACRVTAKRISIRCAARRAADVECARAMYKGDLAAEVFGREISVTWHPH